MRLVLSLVVVVFAIVTPSWSLVTDGVDVIQNHENESHNEKRQLRRKGFLGAHKKAVAAARANEKISIPIPDSTRKAKLPIMAPPEPMPEHLKKEKLNVLAPVGTDEVPDKGNKRMRKKHEKEKVEIPVPKDKENNPDKKRKPKKKDAPDHADPAGNPVLLNSKRSIPGDAIMAAPEPMPAGLKSHTYGEQLNIPVADQFQKITKSCVLMEAIYLFAQGFEPKEGEEERHEWKCEFHEYDNAILTLKNLSIDFYEQHQGMIKSGETLLMMTYDAVLEDPDFDASDSEDFWIPTGSILELQYTMSGEEGFRQRRRASVEAQGTHSLLVVHVSDTFGSKPDHTPTQLADDVFGFGNDQHNLVSQYTACSGGKLNFVAAEGGNITNGVAELEIDIPMKFQSSSIVENWILKLAPKVVGPLDQWTLVMFVLPNSVNFAGAAAYTYVGSRHSVFLDKFSDNLLVLMHEIGHNLGNRHSGQGTLSYDDGTCMMGAHVYDDEAPQMCFNGAKSWYFGWYDDKSTIVDPSFKPWEGHFVGVDDYLNGNIAQDSEQIVVARIHSYTSADLFIMYNRQKGVNSQVHEKGDMVTVVEQEGDDGQSWLLAGLSESTKPFRYDNWNNQRSDLIVEVCSRGLGNLDVAHVLVYIDNGEDNLYCPGTPEWFDEDPDVKAQSFLPDNGKDSSGLETARLPIVSNSNMYREADDGSMRKCSEVQNLFGPNYNLQAYRFESSAEASIPAGAIIESADIYVFPDEKEKFLKRPLTGQVVGHAAGNAPQNKGIAYHISNAKKTNARVELDPGMPKWDPEMFQELADVAPIVQEIVHRSDYKEGNTIELFLVGDSAISTRRILTQDGFAPVLVVKFRPGGGVASPDERGEAEEKQVQLEITDSTDDYIETPSGTLKPKGKLHMLWSTTAEKQAYRFTGVPVPPGATVLEARLEMFGRKRSTMGKDIRGFIHGEKTGDSKKWKYKNFQLTNAVPTDAVTRVEKVPKWRPNRYNTVGDVTSIVQEIVNLGDYSEGNAIKLLLTNDGSSSARNVKTADSGKGARLIIRYES